MAWQQTKKIFFIAMWISVLAWPLLGWYQVARLAGFILMGGVAWILLDGALRSGLFEPAVRRVRVSVGELRVPPRRIATAAAFVLLSIVPFFLDNYTLDILTLAGIYVVLDLGLNREVGMAGLLDIGYVSFNAIGAYT
jgi:hypothetical protein